MTKSDSIQQDEQKDNLLFISNDFIRQNNSSLIKIKSSKKPSFIKDVSPYFTPSVLFIFYLYISLKTGNYVIGGWIIYVFTPLYNKYILDDNQNLDR